MNQCRAKQRASFVVTQVNNVFNDMHQQENKFESQKYEYYDGCAELQSWTR